ncbi:hypothetical protein BHM03_00051724 [Ensete ventricosum]|nr:hypothetical protein BHM03_00051724 [Ensete ventricosum]
MEMASSLHLDTLVANNSTDLVVLSRIAAGPRDASTLDHTTTLVLQQEINTALLVLSSLSRNMHLALAVLGPTQGLGSSAFHGYAGTTKLHIELEELVARFVGKPAAITFGMGYVTNSSIIPALVGEVCTIYIYIYICVCVCLCARIQHAWMSLDSHVSSLLMLLNRKDSSLVIPSTITRSSMVLELPVQQCRFSDTTVSAAALKHEILLNYAALNSPVVTGPSHLEEVLREQIVKGQPGAHTPWKKILVIVEGIYSMEGEFCKLPEIVAICKKYKV